MDRVQRRWLRRIGRYVPGKKEPGQDTGTGEPDEAGEETALAPGDGDEDGIELPDDDGEGEPVPGEDAGEQNLSIPNEVAEERERQAQEDQQQEQHNPFYAPQAFALQGHYQRDMASRFARMISKVAEDSADFPTPGDDEWDIPELLQRRFTGRHINQCRMTREKRKVVVILDTSPSCLHQASLFRNIAVTAESLGDCELYDAPNFALMARKSGDVWEQLPTEDRDWHFEGRVVLAFGDFDGIERICRATAVRAQNRIYWFSCEERPQVLEMQREVFVNQYHGHYLVTPDMQRLMRAMRRVR